MPNSANNADAFYTARDRRTREYGAKIDNFDAPVTLMVPPDIAISRAAQVACFALVDMMLRVHRNVRLDLPDVPLSGELPKLAAGDMLRTAANTVAAAIDPFQNPSRAATDGEIVIVVAGRAEGIDASAGDVVVGWAGGRGEVHVRGKSPAPTSGPAPEPDDDADVLGAATAACLGAAAIFALVNGSTPRPAAVNLLTHSEDGAAGYQSVAGPIDIGVVHAVGGGAVGHALTYWTAVFGVVGHWMVIDNDDCEIHNANRCMGMSVADAGWPGGIPGGAPEKKAANAATNLRPPADHSVAWYHQVTDDLPRPDLLLLLANEFDVRSFVSQRGEELLLHATTGPHWTAELHRHIADVDDCPGCRFKPVAKPTFACSEGPAVPTMPTTGDAALPFLSATAGLMLTVALIDLGTDRRVLASEHNHWRLNLELPPGKLLQAMRHRPTRCVHVLNPAVRQSLHAEQPRRWDDIGSPRPNVYAKNT